MNPQKAVTILNKWGGLRNKTTWLLEGSDDTNYQITDNGGNPKFKKFEFTAIAKAWIEKNKVSAIPVPEQPTTIVLTPDSDEDTISLFIAINSNGECESWAKVVNGKAEIANLPTGNYKIIAIDNLGNALRTEDLTI